MPSAAAPGLTADGRRPAIVAASLLLLAALASACGAAAPVPPGTTTSGAAANANPYFTAAFTTSVNPFTFGQDPTYAADGRVLSAEKDRAGVEQVYVSTLDGGAMKCLTCGQPGPNGFPQERPQGDWALFCSLRGATTTFGSPCLGGVGTDLYVMRPDGTAVTRLTAPGDAVEPPGTPYDNYHPYWSPDGRHLVWTHISFLPESAGGAQWTILQADFTDNGGVPSLTHVVVVGPGGGNAYETQAWAPDGSGFLYTALSSAGHPDSGWLNSELYFMRLYGHGASPAHPQITHLTDDDPSWDEQAVFTPDMRDVIFMSSRGYSTWYQMVVTAARQIGYDPPMQNETAGAMFVETILDPGFKTDLYELDLANGAVRRLTDLDRIIPEFTFDPTGTRLLWSEGGNRSTVVGRFALSAAPARLGPRVTVTARWEGAPVSAPVSVPAPVRPATGPPSFNARSIPSSVLEGLTMLQAQLHTLAARLGDLPAGARCCQTPT